MSVRSDVRQMVEKLLPRNGQCPGDPAAMFGGFIAEGQPEPAPPRCRSCGAAHWPPDPAIWYCVVGRSVPWLPDCR
jgi:hypothetical protein